MPEQLRMPSLSDFNRREQQKQLRDVERGLLGVNRHAEKKRACSKTTTLATLVLLDADDAEEKGTYCPKVFRTGTGATSSSLSELCRGMGDDLEKSEDVLGKSHGEGGTTSGFGPKVLGISLQRRADSQAVRRAKKRMR